MNGNSKIVRTKHYTINLIRYDGNEQFINITGSQVAETKDAEANTN